MSNIEKLLNTPLEYLLTIDTKENLENIKDENGLTVMHWAIVKRNIPKIKELLHLNFNFNDIFSINNVLQTIKIENLNNKSLEKIFNLETYNPIQLCMFLVDYLDNKEGKQKEFKVEILFKEYLNILSIIVEKINLQDLKKHDNNFSILDYAFILENVHLIKLLSIKDNNYSNLHKVKPNIALKIIEGMKVKYKIDNSLTQVEKELKIISEHQSLIIELNDVNLVKKEKEIKKI